MVLPGARSRNAPPKKQAECDKFIDHAQIADGYLCELAHFVSVFVFLRSVSEAFSSPRHVSEAIVGPYRMRLMSKSGPYRPKKFQNYGL